MYASGIGAILLLDLRYLRISPRPPGTYVPTVHRVIRGWQLMWADEELIEYG